MTAAVSEYSEVERPFLLQLAEQGWSTIDQGSGVPQDPKPSMRESFRQWLLPEVFNEAIRAINRTGDGKPSDAFWNEVDKVLPDYLERKEWLRQRGAALDL